MITQYEIPGLLKDEMPLLSGNVHTLKVSMTIYQSLQCFTDYTLHAIEEHNINLTRKCFMLAERLYKQGDGLVRSVIENVFVYSFTKLMTVPTDHVEKLILRAMIPPALHTAYIKQVTSSGC